MSSEPPKQEDYTSVTPAGDFISSVEAASEFGYSNDHIARICRLGEVACERNGKLWRVSRASLQSYVEATLKAQEERRQAQSERFRKELNGGRPSRTVFVPRVAEPSPYETFTRTVVTHTAIFFLAFAISIPLGQLFHSTTPSRAFGIFSFDMSPHEQRGAVLGAQASQLALSFHPSSWISALSDWLWGELQVYVPPPVVRRELVPTSAAVPTFSTPTTIVQNITQPLTISGVSTELLTTRLQELENALRSEIYLYSSRAERGVSGNYRAIQLSQVINNLDGVTITNPIISGGSISGTSGLGATSLNGLSDVALSGAAYGNVLLHNGTEWVNVATSSLGIAGGGGSSFGQAFELTSGALAPTTTVGVIVSASSTITALSSTYGTTTNATSTNLFASNFTLGSLTGILRATAGVVATATIDLVNDVGSSILAVANGGTGWANLQANTLLLGNGTSRVATTSAGTNGQILSLVSGVPSWVATTTFNTPLNYAAGAVTLDTSGTWSGTASLASALAANGANCSAGNAPLGVDASGAVEGCFDVWTEAENTSAAYTPQSRSLTIAGTANQITSSVGAQDLSGDRTWTLSIPSLFSIQLASTTGLSALGKLYAGNGSATTTIQGNATSTFGAGIEATYLNVTGTAATSTFARGIDLAGGCFAINGTCVGGGSGSPSGSDGQLQYNNGGSFGGASSVYYDDVNNLLGIGSTSPWAKLAINPVAGDTNQFVVGSSTATSFIINSAGNVGIGTTSPIYKFSISDATSGATPIIGISGENNELVAVLGDQASGAGDDDGFLGLYDEGVLEVFLTTNGNSYINSGGNVGIGTTSPAGLLHLNGSVGGNFAPLVFTNSGNTVGRQGFRIAFDNDRLTFQRGSDLGAFEANYFSIDQDTGKVGIGTTTPLHELDVYESASPRISINADGANSNSGIELVNDARSWLIQNQGADSDKLYFHDQTAAATRMVIDSSGNVGVGTTSPWRKFSVADTVASAQLALAYDTTRYATFQVTSVGDLVIEAQGDDVSLLDENLYVCTGGSCPSAPSGTGHLIVEGQLVLPNGTAPTVNAIGSIALDTTDNQLLIGTSTNASFPAVFPLEQPLFSITVGSTTPEFIGSGTIPIGKWVSEGREITRFSCFVKSGTSKVVNVTDGTNDTETITCATTHTADTSVDTNATFTAGELWYVEFGATSGAVDYVTFTAYGAITRE